MGKRSVYVDGFLLIVAFTIFDEFFIKTIGFDGYGGKYFIFVFIYF